MREIRDQHGPQYMIWWPVDTDIMASYHRLRDAGWRLVEIVFNRRLDHRAVATIERIQE